MEKRDDSRRLGQRRIDDRAMGVFLQALKRGAVLQDAALAAGFALSSFSRLRKRDPAFGEAWDEAIEISAAPRWIAPGNGRKWQLKKTRLVRFEGWRMEVFLAHFQASCDFRASAEAAGVHETTVGRHRAKNSEFDAACERALAIGYDRLEAELIRQRLEAQRRLRDGEIPDGETAPERTVEFERTVKLIERWERRRSKPARNGRTHEWSFEQAIEEIDRSLRALGLRRGTIAPPAPEGGGSGAEGGEKGDAESGAEAA